MHCETYLSTRLYAVLDAPLPPSGGKPDVDNYMHVWYVIHRQGETTLASGTNMYRLTCMCKALHILMLMTLYFIFWVVIAYILVRKYKNQFRFLFNHSACQNIRVHKSSQSLCVQKRLCVFSHTHGCSQSKAVFNLVYSNSIKAFFSHMKSRSLYE